MIKNPGFLKNYFVNNRRRYDNSLHRFFVFHSKRTSAIHQVVHSSVYDNNGVYFWNSIIIAIRFFRVKRRPFDWRKNIKILSFIIIYIFLSYLIFIIFIFLCFLSYKIWKNITTEVFPAVLNFQSVQMVQRENFWTRLNRHPTVVFVTRYNNKCMTIP
jgi:hypothetical protein